MALVRYLTFRLPPEINKPVVCFFCVEENRWFAIPWNTLYLFWGRKKKITAKTRKTPNDGKWFGLPTGSLVQDLFNLDGMHSE